VIRWRIAGPWAILVGVIVVALTTRCVLELAVELHVLHHDVDQVKDRTSFVAAVEPNW
jgi:hypothetical protein